MRALVLAGVAAAVGTVHAAVNGRLLRVPRAIGVGNQVVAVLLPVRDEEVHVRSCLTRLLDQELVPQLRILVLDDCSTDRTAAIVADVAADDGRVRLLTGSEPPPGWLGKPHACAQLVAACCPTVDVLVFVDADVLLEPLAVAAAVSGLSSLGVDMVSPFPRQVAISWAERLVQPLLAWSWLTFVPLRIAGRSGRPSLAVATGQFIAVRRAAYERAGGHASVRGAVMEDLALARNIRRAGGRTTVVDGTSLAQCRMYRGWDEVDVGYTKSLWSAFGSPVGAVAIFAALSALYVVPALAAMRGSRLGLAGYVLGVIGRTVTASRTGDRIWPDVLLHPLSVTVAGYLTAHSYWLRRRGALVWKGRQLCNYQSRMSMAS